MKLLIIALVILLMIDPYSPESADAFAEKMEFYYGIHTQYEMRYLAYDWWSATLAKGDPLICTDTVYLSTRFKDEQSPIWKWTLAHEWAHVLQKENCVNNEKQADTIALIKLVEANEWKAFLAGVNFLLDTNQITMEEVKDILQRRGQ